MPVLSIQENSFVLISRVAVFSDCYYTCHNFGELIVQDLNAAMNILDEDLRNTSGKIFYCTDGECVRLACKHSDFFVCKCDCYSERLAY